MSCANPVEISRYVYSPSHGGRIKRYFLVPCGHCLGCLKTRQLQIAFRGEWEALDPSNVLTYFVTLTYADEYLPKDNELSKDEFQRFIRRLRKYCPDTRIRYIACGEYGDKRGRAHYHCLLYFNRFVDYSSITKAWKFGIVSISDFLPARAGYVAKYSVKQIGDKSVHLQEPFVLISNDVGMFFLKRHGDYCLKNYVSVWENSSGVPVYLPRVFLERLFPPKDKVHFEASLVSDAKAIYYDKFAGNAKILSLKRRCGYEAFLDVQAQKYGLENGYLYAARVQIGAQNKQIHQMNRIFNKPYYETFGY